ncbi:flagellar protein FlgN [Stenotrophomonas sp. MMGLT7]|uniref:flagellar protein FlgN n=1 Tax=Stenotrophomonas sp. MMGLT7 TaxID=2901227 RepID=UPI001E400F5B|nr:flagellar protein FlgN [Stenotrophomonas sp. MMGLT7]MCD7100240.1 flagellar protein FlgN [Stenotrophomonas sp. MMGLT7]
MSDSPLALLDRLDQAIAGERQALIEHDVQALIQATAAKLEALRALELDVPHGAHERLHELAEANRANGALLSRRRREVNWALRQLGRSESAPAYDARGQSSTVQASRSIAVA